MQFNIAPYADLATAQTAAKADIDDAAGRARGRYLTVVPGQEATYLLKAADADAYKAAGYPTVTTPYPWVSQEVLATGLTATAAADAVIAQRDAWVLVGASIEHDRISGKQSTDAAATIASVMRQRDTTVSLLDLA